VLRLLPQAKHLVPGWAGGDAERVCARCCRGLGVFAAGPVHWPRRTGAGRGGRGERLR